MGTVRFGGVVKPFPFVEFGLEIDVRPPPYPVPQRSFPETDVDGQCST